MNCQICSQWNPKGARRCAFCGNDPAATDDQTASGELLQPGQTRPTSPPTTKRAEAVRVAPPEEEPLTWVHYIGVGLLGLGLLMVLLGLVIRC